MYAVQMEKKLETTIPNIPNIQNRLKSNFGVIEIRRRNLNFANYNVGMESVRPGSHTFDKLSESVKLKSHKTTH